MKNMNKILSSVLEKIKPPAQEKLAIDKNLSEFEKKLKPLLKKKNIKLFVGGSLAKQTLVKRDTNYDIDIFILFPYQYKTKSHELSKFLEQILKAAKLKYIKLKGSRDYFQCKFKSLVLELIPILAIAKASQAVNITDVSPLHVNYVLKKIKQNPKLNDETRFAKAFCYSGDCYGAESYIRGFSGYSLELLTSYYSSFIKFIKTASKWKIPTTKENKIIVDPAKHYQSKAQVLKSMNEARLHSPLILIDPVQRERNATAALSYETFARFIKSCKAFLSKPSEKFFFKENLDIQALKKEAKKAKAKFIILKALSTKKKIDIAGAKLKKFYEFLFFLLKKNGFKVIKGTFDFSEKTLESKFYFIIKEPSKHYIVSGPPLNVGEKYVKAFKRKWPKAFIKNKRLYAKATRKISSVRELAKLISKNQLKEMGIKKIVIA